MSTTKEDKMEIDAPGVGFFVGISGGPVTEVHFRGEMVECVSGSGLDPDDLRMLAEFLEVCKAVGVTNLRYDMD